jgi:hypothetical protein
MVRLAAIISFFMSLVCYGWSIKHGAWSWELFMLLGMFLWCVSGAHDRVP